MSNRIISCLSNRDINFPIITPSVLTEEKEYNGRTLVIGDYDWEEFENAEPITLFASNDRKYYSVPNTRTLQSLIDNSESDCDIREETSDEVKSYVVDYLLTYKKRHLDKYIEDNTYLNSLGLPDAPEFLPSDEEESEPVGVATT